MKLSKYTLLYILLVGIVILTGCSDHLFDDEKQANSNRILLSGDIEQLAVTRVNDNGFCDGDKMGVYIVDYEGDYPGTLKVSGNRADNVQHTFDGITEQVEFCLRHLLERQAYPRRYLRLLPYCQSREHRRLLIRGTERPKQRIERW